MDFPQPVVTNIKELFMILANKFKGSNLIPVIAPVAYSSVVQHNWSSRNDALFNDQRPAILNIKRQVKADDVASLATNNLEEDSISNKNYSKLRSFPYDI